MQIQMQLLEACRRLAGKGLLSTPADSLSMRIPGVQEMLLAATRGDWRRIGSDEMKILSTCCKDGGLHAAIYRTRADVGAVAISSPRGVQLLAGYGGALPPVFDEQVRQIGSSVERISYEASAGDAAVSRTFARGANAALLGSQLLCLGMTCERVLLNTELYEKCARAYVIARASGGAIGRIPFWVRLIANRRLMKDERRAASSYRDGRIPERVNAY